MISPFVEDDAMMVSDMKMADVHGAVCDSRVVMRLNGSDV